MGRGCDADCLPESLGIGGQPASLLTRGFSPFRFAWCTLGKKYSFLVSKYDIPRIIYVFLKLTCHGNRLEGSRTGKPSKGPLKMRGVYDVGDRVV